MRKYLPLIVSLFFLSLLPAQAQVSKEALRNTAKKEILNAYPHLKSSSSTDWIITDHSYSKKNNRYYVYLRQTQAGTEIINANLTLAIQDNKVVHRVGKVIDKLPKNFTKKSPSLSPVAAIQKAAEHLKLRINAPLQLEKNASLGQAAIYSSGGISLEPIPVKQVYWQNEQGELKLAWDLSIYPKDQKNWWSLRIDAENARVLEQGDWVCHCRFDDVHNTSLCAQEEFFPPKSLPSVSSSGEQYNVFAYPLESPNHGDRSLSISPFDSNASPFGWHDDDGVSGAEYTFTRGNNVHAYEDRASLNSPGFNPDGGAELNFDFPITLDGNEENFRDASIVNLFYWNNFIHDILDYYGFDEASGNFQEKNYSGLGQEGDYVRAEAQDGSGFNNANFGTPPDGFRPRMQMFLWEINGQDRVTLRVNSPFGLAGTYSASAAVFGPELEESLTGELVLALSESNSLACTELSNPLDIQGKIALIDRGSCNFVDKARNAQAAGAIAMVVITDDRPVISMGLPSGDDGSDINIPCIMISNSNGNLIRQELPGVNVTLNDRGAKYIGSSLDNGIIVHEYGHGVSNRLTGGPSNTSCLSNQEQMGEGWSDYLALMFTLKEGDNGSTPRGIGTFARNQPITGRGIRPAPYTTNMSVNPYTYANAGDGNISVPHGVGFIWCTTLWDMTWLLIDRYGFDADFREGTGGNNIALQLVMDGMKLQPCNPGFVDGRDAILLADRLNNGGANQDLIWEAFARRGLGADADQGSTNSRSDGSSSFEIPTGIEIEKSVEQVIAQAGEELEYTIEVRNIFNTSFSNIQISDQLPEGLDLVEGSLSAGASHSAGEIEFDQAELGAFESIQVSFRAVASSDQVSSVSFIDDQESGGGNWTTSSVEGSNNWTLSSANPRGGSQSWRVEDPNFKSEQILALASPVEIGIESKLIFWHSFITEASYDGGVVEISTDEGATWQDLGGAIERGGYSGRIDGQTNSVLAGEEAFNGNSQGYIETRVDLSTFSGENALIRFRFASDGSVGGEFWYIDDVLLINSPEVYVENQACIRVDGVSEELCSETTSTIIISESAPECRADAGDLVPSSSLVLPITFCEDDGISLSFSASYEASDENDPIRTHDYIYLLSSTTSPYNIIAQSTNGVFDDDALEEGEYLLWGFSYYQGNANAQVEEYLLTQNNVESIQADIDNEGLCADLDNRYADGSLAEITKTPCTAILPITGDVSIQLFPNPAQHEIFLKIAERNQKRAAIEIFNAQGLSLMRQEFQVDQAQYTRSIDARNMAPGLYLIQLSIGEETFSGRIIIQK